MVDKYQPYIQHGLNNQCLAVSDYLDLFDPQKHPLLPLLQAVDPTEEAVLKASGWEG